MVILNIWSFNAFYVFEIPYLLILFVLVLVIIYWIDKKNIYRHYKMKTYLSIDLEMEVQKHYIIMFLLCISLGYLISSFKLWQYIFAGIMFVFGLLANYMISFTYNRKKEEEIKKTSTLGEMMKAVTMNPKQSMRQNLLEMEMKDTFLVVDTGSSRSMGSVSFGYGYEEIYRSYLQQFKNPAINKILKETYDSISLGIFKNIELNESRVSEMTKVEDKKERKKSENIQIQEIIEPE